MALPHRTQILYLADIAFITSWLDVKRGSLVIEAGMISFRQFPHEKTLYYITVVVLANGRHFSDFKHRLRGRVHFNSSFYILPFPNQTLHPFL